jgi:hypothetical protein
MSYIFFYNDKEVTSIVEDYEQTAIAAAPTEYYVKGTIQWAIDNLPLWGLNIDRIYLDGYAESIG